MVPRPRLAGICAVQFSRADSIDKAQHLLQVGQGGHAVVAGPAVRLGELSLYFPEEFLLDLRVGGQQVRCEHQRGRGGLVSAVNRTLRVESYLY